MLSPFPVYPGKLVSGVVAPTVKRVKGAKHYFLLLRSRGAVLTENKGHTVCSLLFLNVAHQPTWPSLLVGTVNVGINFPGV